MTSAPNASERFRRACAGQPVDRPPVWLMRQAGRYMAEYRAVRARHSLLDICHTPALAAEVTITAAERLGTDAAIIFADLLLPCEPLGLQLEFTVGEGPQITPALRTREQIHALPSRWAGRLDNVSEAIARVVRHFGPSLPVLGFVGAPFTLASYLIEGASSRTFAATKQMMWTEAHQPSGAWAELMQKLTEGLAGFAAEQVAAGAAAIQIFDSWVGALAPADYQRAVLPYIQQLVESTQSLGVPAIYFSTGTTGYLELTAQTRARVLSLDWRIELDDAWQRLAPLPAPVPALQGNLDPLVLLASPERIHAEARRLLCQAQGHPGYIFNLGHGILPQTPVENVQTLIRAVQA